jgi:thiamine monophosphate kinase
LSDGEDFELLLAVPPNEAKQMIADQPIECPITDIGELTVEAGLQQRSPEGKLSPLEPAGYVHHS